MPKKLLSVLLVLTMVLTLLSGLPVMAEETMGGPAETILENEPAAEGIPENPLAAEEIQEDEPAEVIPENEPVTEVISENESAAEGIPENEPVTEVIPKNESAVKDISENDPASDKNPSEVPAAKDDNDSAPAPKAAGAFTRDVNEKSTSAKNSASGAEPALVGTGEESRETVGMRVWTPGHGRVLVNGSDYGTEFSGTWYKGTEVSVEAVPDSGYRLDHWWVRKENGSGEWVGTADNTLIAGADTEAAAYFGLLTAYLNITPPTAGSTATEAPQVSVPDGAGYGIDTGAGFWGPALQWVKSDHLYGRERLDPDTSFEAGGTYYAYVRLRDGADRFSATAGGSTFNTDLQVNGGTKTAQGNFAATEEGGGGYIGIETIIAVTIPEADTHTVTFDMRGHYTEVASQKVADGEKAVIPASPVYLDRASDYDTTGLVFSRWNKYAPEDLTYDTFWNEGYPFRDPVTEDMTIHAIYETVLTLRAYDLTNSTERKGGTFTWSDIYWRVPQTETGVQTTAIEGVQETLTANPDPGYKFVGWSSDKSKDTIECTDPVYTFTNTGRKTLYALFEEEAPLQNLTLKFTNMSMSSASLSDLVSSVSVNGEEWPLPDSGMQVTGQIPAGDSVSVVVKAADTVAIYHGQPSSGIAAEDFVADIPEDGQNLTAAFTMPGNAVTVNVGAGRTVLITYDVNGGIKGPAWPGDSVRQPDFAVLSPTRVVERALVDLLTGEVVAEPPANHKYAGLEITDKNGVHSGAPGQRITGLDLSEGATFRILWEKEKTVTIHWSSIDGVDLMDPIEIPFTAGDRLGDILEASGFDFYESPFEKDGYIPFGCFYDRPITEFASYDEMQASYDGKLDASTVVNDSMDVYAIMLKEVTDAELAIEQPVCGTSTEVAADGWVWTDQTNPPAVSVPGGGNYRLGGNETVLPAIWGVDFTDCYEGDFVGGEEYYADVMLEPEFGYKFAAGTDGTFDGEIAVSGGELVKADGSAGALEVNVKVAAEHDPAEPVIENVVLPGCTDAGSHDEVIHCKGCGAELSSTTVEDAALGHNWGEWMETGKPSCTEPGEETRTCGRCEEKESRVIAALGHDWGAWVVTKEATDTEDGEETRTCARCKETETRVIPHLVIEYRNTEGDGSTWEKGSAAALKFVFRRNIKDEETFSHFTAVRVDGTDVDAANYTAETGSLLVNLKPEYLETLSYGEHTLTVSFDDGNDPSAVFTIKEKKQEAAPTDNKTSGTTTVTKKTGTAAVTKKSSQTTAKGNAKSPKTGDSQNPLLWLTILAASIVVLYKGVQYRRKARR